MWTVYDKNNYQLRTQFNFSILMVESQSYTINILPTYSIQINVKDIFQYCLLNFFLLKMKRGPLTLIIETD